MKYTLATALFACTLAAPGSANGRNPGSILIYPEFRSGNGAETIVTVTNTHPTESIVAHFKYVNGDVDLAGIPCAITNRPVTLRPLDTFTNVVSTHLPPGPTRGYLWVVAEQPTGTAVSFNYLVGDLMVVDAALSAAYSIEPLPVSSPVGHGLPTDLEPGGGDGVRDLNGLEYEKGPARVHVPRFMGQNSAAAPTLYNSDLVLIGLSGGRRFTTIVDFLAFNDNEEIFSAQYAFQCWTKVPLIEINGIFTHNFLHNATDQDPTEVVGNTYRETGFFWVEGNVASSTSTDIFDPSILAVLIERSGEAQHTAELPFLEYFGNRPGGDLLPGGNTWDQD